MEIEVRTTQTKKVEIKIPFYCTDGVCHAYKIYSEDKCIAINYSTRKGDDVLEIGTSHAGLAFNSRNSDLWKEITEAEFIAIFEKTKLELTDLAK